MNITRKKLITMDNEEIYKIVLPVITNYYISYNYLDINEKELKTILMEIINESKKNYDGKIEYSKYILKVFSKYLKSKINNNLKDDSKIIELMNSFINKNITIWNSEMKNINELNKFTKILQNLGINISPEQLTILLEKNNKLNIILDMIFNKYKDKIVNGKIEDIILNLKTISLIELYCDLNNIEIKYSEQTEQVNFHSTDGVREYLNEIGKIPLITFEEEKDLATKAQYGDKKAKDKLINSNLRLVVTVAKRYLGRGLPFLDLIQEGNIGLITAVDRYNPNLGFRFSTYATWWIKQSITKALNYTARNIRIPLNMMEKTRKYNNAIKELTNILGREPYVEEIMKELNLSRKEVIELHNLTHDTISLNEPIDEDSEIELSDKIEDGEENVEEKFEISNLKELLLEIMNEPSFRKRDREVLLLRFGFKTGRKMTLEEVGKIYNIKSERVRQIEARALKQMRYMSKTLNLAIYTNSPEKSLKNLERFKQLYAENPVDHKSYLNDKEIKDTVNQNEVLMINSIYESLTYSEEEINCVISLLSKEEQNILNRIYGNDLSNPKQTTLSEEDRFRFNEIIIPKMKRLLEKKYSKKLRYRTVH